MVKRISLITILLLSLIMPSLYASNNYPYVEDRANILSSEEVKIYEEKFESYKTKYNVPVYFYSTYEDLGSNIRRTTDLMLMDRVGKNNNGILLLIDFNSSELHLSTSGYAIDVLNDARIESILDAVTANVRSYPSEMMRRYSDMVDNYLSSGPVEGQYRVKEKSLSMIDIGIALITGAIAFLVSQAAYKKGATPSYKQYVFPLLANTLMNLAINNDELINTRRSVRAISTSSSSSSSGKSGGGRSTTHSSGGGTFGGGGRKF